MALNKKRPPNNVRTQHLKKSPFHSPRSYFVSLSQALEAYDRAVSPTHVYMEKDQYEKDIEPVVINAIPTVISKDFRARMKSAIKFAYQFSLRTRLRRLTDEMPVNCKTLLFSDPKIFVDKIVYYRNSLTHGDPDELNVPSAEQLQYASSGLKLFFLTLVLSRWGVPENLIIDGFRHSWDYKWSKIGRLW